MELPDKEFRPCPRCSGEGRLHRISGSQLRSLRLEAGLNIGQMATLLGLSYSYVYKTEKDDAWCSEQVVAALLMIDVIAPPAMAILEGDGEECPKCYGLGKLPAITGRDLKEARLAAEEEIGRKIPLREMAEAFEKSAGYKISVSYISEIELGSRGNRADDGNTYAPEHFIELYMNYEPEPSLGS
jgi:transcriptional regulator with XRE-family HTH domain